MSRSFRAASVALAHPLVGRLAADLDRPPGDLDPELAKERLRDRARRDVDGRVPCRSALECVADVVVAVLEDAREVGVAGPGQRHGLRSLPGGLALRRPGAHPPRPVRVVAVAHDERERRPERRPMPEPREHLDLVRLELLPRAPPVALLATPEVGIDRVLLEPKPGREPGHDRGERRPVRFACGHQPEGHAAILRSLRPVDDGCRRARQSGGPPAT